MLAAGAVGLGCAALAATVFRPTRRLAPRVRPYTLVARSALGHAPDVVEGNHASTSTGAFGPVFGPPLRALAGRRKQREGAGADERLQRLLLQSGVETVTVEEFRVRQIGAGAMVAFVAGVLAA